MKKQYIVTVDDRAGLMMYNDPFEVAKNHIAYLISIDAMPIDFFKSVKQTPPRPIPTWNDAIWECAKIQDEMARNYPDVLKEKFTKEAVIKEYA